MFAVVERVHVLDAGDLLDADHALVARLVGEPRRAGDVADGIDARLAGAQPLVDRRCGSSRPSTLVPSRPRSSTLPTMPTARMTRSAVISWLLPPTSMRRRDAVVALLQAVHRGAGHGSSCPASRSALRRRPRPPRPRPAGCGRAPRRPSPRRPWCGRSSRTRCRSRRSRSPAATSGSPPAPSPPCRSRPACRRARGPAACRARAPVARMTFLAVSVGDRSCRSSPPRACLAPRELGRAVEHRDLVLLHQALDAVAELASRPCASARRSSWRSKRDVLDR